MQLILSIRRGLRTLTQSVILFFGNITLLLASNPTSTTDPFASINAKLASTQTNINSMSIIVLGISFIYAAIAGAWFHRWKQAFGVVIAGVLIGLGPSIINWAMAAGR